MTRQVLILGGCGRIGSQVARDVATHTDAVVVVTGRKQPPQLSHPKLNFLGLDLQDLQGLQQAVSQSQLVVHCAGPFHHRDGRVLKACIDHGVNYVDVSDHRSFLQRVLPYREEVQKAGVTAILNTGIFPGISNSMVRQGVEQLDEAEKIHLSYGVAGSGGAGVTVMRTTFLGLREKFLAWIDGKWQQVSPYSQREIINFPPPYGQVGVYWFDVPETYTFAESFGVKTVVTKFGSIPDFYNHLTWMTAHLLPSAWVQSPLGIEFLSQVSYQMTVVTDRFTGVGVAMRAEITGKKDGKLTRCCSTMSHESTAVSAGYGTGSLVEQLLQGKIQKPGIWPVEQALSTELFEQGMASRGIKICQEIQTLE